MDKKRTYVQQVYLDLLVASNYPEQEPEYIAAKWYHLLWLLIPIMGFLMFIEGVKVSYKNHVK